LSGRHTEKSSSLFYTGLLATDRHDFPQVADTSANRLASSGSTIGGMTNRPDLGL
jgi:hypothetical protein